MNQEQRIIHAALAQARHLRKVHGSPQIIKLSAYASDEDLHQLRPEDGPDATSAQQRRIVDAVAAALRGDGHLVKIVTLRSVDYLKWLSENHLPNTAGNRAAFISL